jgi:hypothetical protein
MSGWDVSSTPKWGPQDGPEETQAFPGQGDGSRDFGQDFGAQDFGRGGPSSPPAGFPEAGGGFPGESAAGGPPPEFFGQEYGQDHEIGPGGFPQRTPGRSFEDLPRREARGRHSSAPGGGYGQESGYGADSGYGQETNGAYGHENSGYGQETSYGQDGGFGQDHPFGQETGYGQDGGFGQDNPFGQDSAFGQDWGGGAEAPDAWGAGGGQQGDGGWGRAAGRSAAPWEERPQQDAGYPGLDGQQDFGQQDFGRQDYTRQAPRADFGGQDYDGGQDFGGQQGPGPQESLGFDRGDRDMAARMDPALQDFFAPQRGGTGGYPGQGPGRPGDRDSRYRPPTDGWEDPGRSRTGTGPRPASRGPRRDDDEPRRGLGMKGLIAIGVVVAVVIVAGVVLFTHKSGGSSPTASNTPAGGGATASAAKPTATGKGAAASGTGTPGAGASGGAGAAAAAYTLSTPSTAGGYPLGQDPNFLTTATNTAKQISGAVTAGGGGTVKGNPVSAAYRLPAAQVITFVGYEGTFTPEKVLTILATLGSNPHTYQAGPNGGALGCANTKSTPSGAVCVWATSSTLGVTEFFDANGPETLNAAQSKGAADTVKLRADVEKKKA